MGLVLFGNDRGFDRFGIDCGFDRVGNDRGFDRVGIDCVLPLVRGCMFSVGNIARFLFALVRGCMFSVGNIARFLFAFFIQLSSEDFINFITILLAFPVKTKVKE